MQVRAALHAARRRRAALLEHIGEQITERGRGITTDANGKVETFEAESHSVHRDRGTADRVVAMASLRIDQRFVRFRDTTELLRRNAVARIDVGVEFSRKPLVRALDVSGVRLSLHSEQQIEIHG